MRTITIYLKVKGIICLLFAIATLVFPRVIAPLYGLSITFTALYFTNLFGVCFMGIGLICWFTSMAQDSAYKKSVLLSLAVTDTFGFGFMLKHQLSGDINALGWTTVGLWFVFAAGCWYFYRNKA